MSQNYIANESNQNTHFLSHYGVAGMKWGIRRAQKQGLDYSSRRTKKMVKKSNIAKESSKEWDDMAKNAAAKGDTKNAKKYRKKANTDRVDSKVLSERAKRSQTVDDIRVKYAKKSGIGQSFMESQMTGSNTATNKSLAELYKLNGSKENRTKKEQRARKFVDFAIYGGHNAEMREANKYVYK